MRSGVSIVLEALPREACQSGWVRQAGGPDGRSRRVEQAFQACVQGCILTRALVPERSASRF
jgi:hypothetical protein